MITCEEKKTVTLSLPIALRDRLKIIAKRENRSFSAQVRFFLEKMVTECNSKKEGLDAK